eukprot:gnl/Spiro4/13980_TR7489_c0_g1_i1.p1 gnl/Spiro4/13980_TR7489_c0_g1~~gnl/Spiro4/13980_TR7489_c0_g1_i1.p1  ORF type:complete len:209 (-),score=38.09 gnl/Spiro4/13980_TR7489_c0_g1_i1:323-949(-)
MIFLQLFRSDYYTLDRIRCVARQLLTSLAFVHDSGVIHADIKPDNVMLSSVSRCEVRLIDFGLACFTTDSLPSTLQSPAYRAPEVILGCPYDVKIDIWSVGCLLVELATGSLLFNCSGLPNLLQLITNCVGALPKALLAMGRYTSKYYTRVPSPQLNPPPRAKLSSLPPSAAFEHAPFFDFLQSLLQPWPAHRLSAAQALRHPFLESE